MDEWFSADNLKRAWRYVKIDLRDDFVFDIIDHEDIKQNLESVISSLRAKIQTEQYYPAPLLRVPAPKNEHSVRPGSSIAPVDLLVLYAVAQQLVPLLDPLLSESVYAYRLNPRGHKSGEHLFADRSDPAPAEDTIATTPQTVPGTQVAEEEFEPNFPYNWFANWLPFQQGAKSAAGEHRYVAVTDITAFFENVSLDLLRERLKEKLGPDQRDLIDRLFRLLEFWNWTPTGNLPHGFGLPQGNDVSSFFSNLYLLDLDQAMLKVVSGDTMKYYRYVDDIKLFSSDRNEARKALVELERVLRTLNLHPQTAKTKIKPADEIFDAEVEGWMEKLDDQCPDKLETAVEFFEQIFQRSEIERWQRVYSRCLTVLKQTKDDRAVEIALGLFLADPSYKLLVRNFTYLREFATGHAYGEAISQALTDGGFLFPYHKAYMFRLGAYSRDDSPSLKRLALQEVRDQDSFWLCRAAALQCLDTFALTGQELSEVERLLSVEADPQVLRAAFVVLSQRAGKQLKWVLDRLAVFNAPYQEYLRRYMWQVYGESDSAEGYLNRVGAAKVRAPTFVHNLHQLDLLKATSEWSRRKLFNEMITEKLRECSEGDWPRLHKRLSLIQESFVLQA